MKYAFENRIIQFSISTINLTKDIKQNYAGEYLSRQMIRSSSSAALNYGEAKAGETRKDFIHKLKISLKELHETLICFKIVKGANVVANKELLTSLTQECQELIAMFSQSIITAKKKL